MAPKFSSPESWQHAELLMQPIFIRVIDNIRKQLDESSWQGTYQTRQIWPDGTTPETQLQVTQLQQELAEAGPEEVSAIQQALEQLPQPVPAYELCLVKGDHQVKVDLWELCYRICFIDYSSETSAASRSFDVDTSLMDDAGDVDWHRLDAKVRQLIGTIFEGLPAA